MRRLPVYFVIDVSDSMVGEPLEAVNDGLSKCMEVLRSDPYALETAFINVIAFAGKVEKLVDMEEAYLCRMPEFNVGAGTSFGKALDFLMKDIEANVRKGTHEVKGDWRPVVFFFTDGNPTDNYERVLERWKKNYAMKCNTVMIALGKSVCLSTAQEITEDVIQIKDSTPSRIKNVFKWISSSVQSHSASVGKGDDDKLISADFVLEGGKKINREDVIRDEHPTENCVLLRGKCERTKNDYLLKYDREEGAEHFQYVGSYPIDGSKYESLSAGSTEKFEVDSDLLDGHATCPCCGNDLGLVKCGRCNKIQCASSEDRKATCPWCGNVGQLESARFKLGRSQG